MTVKSVGAFARRHHLDPAGRLWHDAPVTAPAIDPKRIYAIERPDPAIMTLYVIYSFASLIFFPIVLIPLYFRYHTMRYRFDPEGVSVSWGFLFRHETNLTYARIQDIHLSRGLLERWFGLGTVEIQTAAGSAMAEVSIVGVREFELIRDFLYSRMRGTVLDHPAEASPADATLPAGEAGAEAVLGEILAECRAIRTLLTKRPGS
ncbi:MAG: PH domain-containing protein [Planctomycetes bacterium]|nr:PH domain-containing protein [Planctomycetota bacterium]